MSKHSCNFCKHTNDPSNNEFCPSCKTRIGDGVAFTAAIVTGKQIGRAHV